jgi:hypothetical protein
MLVNDFGKVMLLRLSHLDTVIDVSVHMSKDLAHRG